MPIGSMYGIFTYIWHKFMVNVGKYANRPMDPRVFPRLPKQKIVDLVKFHYPKDPEPSLEED